MRKHWQHFAHQEIGKKSIQVVGQVHLGVTEQQKEEKAKIVFGIEQESLLKKHSKAVGPHPRGQLPTPFLPTADKKDLVTQFFQAPAYSPDALIGNEIIGHGYDYPLQGHVI